MYHKKENILCVFPSLNLDASYLLRELGHEVKNHLEACYRFNPWLFWLPLRCYLRWKILNAWDPFSLVNTKN